MSELAQKSREAMKAKIARLIDPTPGKVDSSDYGPEETDHSGEKKTNVKRPINPRAFKRGGAVAEGDKPRPNAGKAQRKAKKAEWSEEAKLAAAARGPVKNETGRRRIHGDENYPVDEKGERVPSYRNSNPVEGLAQKLQREGPRRESSSPSQWEAMMSALPRSGGRRGASSNPYGGRKITSEPEYAAGGEVKGQRKARADGGKTYQTERGEPKYKDSDGVAHSVGSYTKSRDAKYRDVPSRKMLDSAYTSKTGKGLRGLSGPAKRVGSEVETLEGARYKPSGKWDVDWNGNASRNWKQSRATGGRTKHDDAAEDRALVKSMVKKDCRTARSTGGDIGLGLLSPAGLAAKELLGKASGGRAARAAGGRTGGYHVVDEWGHVRHRAKTERGAQSGLERISARGQERKGASPLKTIKIDNPEKYNLNQHPSMMSEDTRKAYGFKPDEYGPRAARATGGRTKGKTNVNVIIATGPQGGQPGMQPPMGAAPVPPPMPAPNAAMPGTSPMPGGPPPAALAAGVPPMPRKRGGRTAYPIETGSGGGRARLDKKDAY